MTLQCLDMSSHTYVKHSLKTREFGVPFSSRLEKVQTGSGAHPSYSSLVTAAFISGVKTCGAWSSLLTTEGKDERSHNSTLPGTFVAYTGRTLSSRSLQVFARRRSAVVRTVASRVDMRNDRLNWLRGLY